MEPTKLRQCLVSVYNGRGSSSHGSSENQSSISNAHKYQDNDETQRGTVEALVPLLPYLRASGSSESEAPCRQDTPPSQPQRPSFGPPRAYRSGSRDGAKKKGKKRKKT